MKRILVFGASGQVGDALLPRLLELQSQVFAISRKPRAPMTGVNWLSGSLEQMPVLPADIDTIISLGPLDAFAVWFAAQSPPATRVIAIGSTGVIDKANSPDAAERALAGRLRDAEAALGAASAQRGIASTLLRPTLLYGSGRDASLSRLLGIAHRWRFLPLPSNARGLRQPVHVADVADAVVRCLSSAATGGRSYDLPGGERLEFADMVRRTVARHAPASRVLMVPRAAVRAVLMMASATGRRAGLTGVLHRLGQDQVADPAAAMADFGYQPRAFEP